MLRFYKVSFDGIIININNKYGEEITEGEFNAILNLILNKPTAESGYDYRLRADTLEWELVELPEPINEEISTDDCEQTLNGLGG